MCLTPIKLSAGYKDSQGVIRPDRIGSVVPCGKCPKCKLKRANAWIFRLLQEEKIHQNSLFVTLTYNQENVPISEKGFMTLKKRDYQLFMKRLRKATGIKTIKYYACGEYGSDTWRPHYHAIMYDVPPEFIDKCWQLGQIHIGTVTGQSIGYTTKYICKEKRVPLHQNDDRLPEFSLMSKNLGRNYLTPQIINWHKQNEASFVVVEGGHKHALPRYYRDFIFTEDERIKLNGIAQQRAKMRFDADVEEAGSPKEFYRNKYYAIRQAVKAKPTIKRNKI